MGIFDFLTGGKESRTTTTVNRPPKEQVKFATGIWKEADRMYGGRKPFQGMGRVSREALNRTQRTARGPNRVLGTGMDAYRDIASGKQRVTTGGAYGERAKNFQRPGMLRGGNYDAIADGRRGIGTGKFDKQYDAAGRPSVLDKGVARDIATGKKGITTGGMFDGVYDQMRNPSRAGAIFGDVNRDMQAPSEAGGMYSDIGAQAGGGSSLDGGMFGKVANGSLVGSNPHREEVIRTAMRDAANATKATMSAKGRYGSGHMGDAMGTALGDIATTARMRGYDTDMGMMMTGAQAQESARQGRMGIGISAAQGLSNDEIARTDRRLGAAQGTSSDTLGRANTAIDAAQGRTGVQSANIDNVLAASAQRASDDNTRLSLQQNAATAAAQWRNQNLQNEMDASLGQSGERISRDQLGLSSMQGQTQAQGSNIGYRLDATAQAPMFQSMRYDDAARLGTAGTMWDANAQAEADYGWGQLNNLAGYAGVMGTGYGTESATKPAPNPLMSLLGWGMGGANMFNGGGY